MKKYNDEDVLLAFRILTNEPRLFAPEDPSTNAWIKYKLFSYMLERDGEVSSVKMYKDLDYKVQKGAALLGQMRDAGIVVTEQRDGKGYCHIVDEYRQKAQYILESGRIVPLNLDKFRLDFQTDDITFDVDKIKTNKDELLKYLKTIVRLESIVYSYAKRYETLCSYRIDVIKSGMSDEVEVANQIAEELAAKKSELKKLEKEAPIEPMLENFEVELSSPAPQKPEVTVSKPIEPSYEKPGLFNKKKVEEQNDALRRAYEAELSKYEAAMDAYKIEYELYVKKLAIYNDEKEALKAKQFEAIKAEYEASLLKFDERRRELEEEISEIKSHTEAKRNQLLLQSEAYCKRLAIDAEIQINKQFLCDTLKALMELYSYGIIYGKYRNMVAVSSFCDYLLAGRCETLEGADGAYNLYEQETRSDLILEKLDKVIASLASIQKNQYFIYSEIQASNARLEKIENQLVANNAIQESQLDMLKQICKNTDGIADALQEIAFNTEVTAFYSKQTKELTDALGYMVALR